MRASCFEGSAVTSDPRCYVRVDYGRCEGVVYDGDAVLAVSNMRVSW